LRAGRKRLAGCVTFRRRAYPSTRKDTVTVRSDLQPESRLLTPAEVAALFRVDPKTVTRWAQQGKLRSIRTLGGHRRYREAEIQAFLDKPQRVPLPRAVNE
jgi:excisionase family DNA binding protein